MLTIKFSPDLSNSEVAQAAEEYQSIWDNEGKQIIQAVEKVSGFKFANADIEATVYDGISHSHPLQLSASYSKEVKKGKLIHELCHKIIADNNIMVRIDDLAEKALEIHKLLDLILYDVWHEMEGEEYAKMMVDIESKRSSIYDHAWRWALALGKDERIKKFRAAAPKRL